MNALSLAFFSPFCEAKFLTYLPFLFVFVFFTGSCGTDDNKGSVWDYPRELPQKARAAPRSKQGDRLKGSYLISFRSQSFPLTTFALERRFHEGFLRDHYFEYRGVKSIEFISGLAFDPIGNFLADNPNTVQNYKRMGSDFLAIDRSNASLARVDFFSEPMAQELIQEWEERGLIEYAEPNYVSKTFGAFEEYAKLFEQSRLNTYFHTAIRTRQALLALDGMGDLSAEKPVIAVLDSGVDVLNAAFGTGDDNNIWQNNAVGQVGCGNDDFYGCNTTFVKKGQLGNGAVFPIGTADHGQTCGSDSEEGLGSIADCPHGTQVASVIAAKPDPDLGIGGVCPVCKIMVLKIVEKSASGGGGAILDSSIAKALKYVAAHAEGNNVRVINASFGKFDRSRSVSALVETLKDTPPNKGPLIIAAAGNEDTYTYAFPAALPSVIATSSMADLNGEAVKLSSSNFGQWVDISAPGSSITTMGPGERNTTEKDGTSFAAPLVAGVAGLVLISKPQISHDDLRRALLSAANPAIYNSEVNQAYLVKSPGQNLRVPLLGVGLVDAEKAVKGEAASGQPPQALLETVNRGCGVIGHGKSSSVWIWVFLLPLLFLQCCLKNKSWK